MLKILFLDIDGVVLSGKELWRTKDHNFLPPDKIDLINEIVWRTGCKIVISSTWRMNDSCLKLLIEASLENIFLGKDWRTGLEYRGEDGNLLDCTRGVQIKNWLMKHPEVSSFVILDDDDDMLEEQMSRFVQTEFEEGIQQSHVERIVELLGEKK